MTTKKNVYYLMPDMSIFTSSDLYKKNKKVITKYLPEKKVFNAVPAYKPYRIVVIALSSLQATGYHTIYTIDATTDTIDDISNGLESLGGINQEDYGMQKTDEAKAQAIQRGAEDEDVAEAGYSRGYSSGYEKKQQEEADANSGWRGFVSGFTAPIQLAMGNKELLGLGLSL
jgi:hypothetical protein